MGTKPMPLRRKDLAGTAVVAVPKASTALRSERDDGLLVADRGLSKRLSPAERRAQIVDVTERLFATHAYSEIGVPDVARAAGITPGLVYHYFPTKEALFLAAYEVRARELLLFCEPEPSLPFEEQVHRGVRGYLDFVEAHGQAYLNLFHGPAVAEEGFVLVCEMTRELMVDRFVVGLGAKDPSRYPALRLALRGYIGYSESVVLAWLEKKQVERAVLETMLLSGILAAVRVGLASEPSPPMSPEEAEKLARRYRKRFALP
jgi:AcrR family transcriptional regulator